MAGRKDWRRSATRHDKLAEQHRFIVAYPHQSRGNNAQSCCNWFCRSDQQRDRGEPAILAGLTREAMALHHVPEGRVIVAGLSAAVAMAVILEETCPDVFSVVGAHSGLPAGSAKDVPSAFSAMAGQGNSAPVRTFAGSAVRTIIFHGSADATVHPSNGEGIVRHALDRGLGQSLQD